MVSARVATFLAALVAFGVLIPAVDGLTVPAVGDAVPTTLPGSAPTNAPAAPTVVNDPAKTLYPYRGVRLDEEPVAPKQGFFSPTEGGVPLQGPYGDLVMGMLSDSPATPERTAARLADFYADMGFDTPGSAVNFEENASISFTYDLGDINGDGVSDLLLDQYCTGFDACSPRYGAIVQDPRGQLDTPCSAPHAFIAVSGVDGTGIWNSTGRDYNAPGGSLQGCHNEFVIGTVPDGNHYDLLVYRYDTTYAGTLIVHNSIASEILLNHRVGLINGENGRMVWSKAFQGHFLSYDQGSNPFATSTNLLVNPILQFVRTQGVDYLPEGTKTGLVLQGVGFNITGPLGAVFPYGAQGLAIISNYQPDEWAQGVDPLNGKVLWSRLTFQPNEKAQGIQIPARSAGPKVPIGNVSVVPSILQIPPIPDTTCMYDTSKGCRRHNVAQFNVRTNVQRYANYYWRYDPCCYDITGDSLPDIVYTVYQYHSLPINNNEGPYGVAGWIVAIDGADGKLLYMQNIETGSDAPRYTLGVQHLGDANGDGAADYFTHQRYFQFDYKHELALVSGKTGLAIWNATVPRSLQIIPLGDANKDGAQDFVFVEYQFDIGKVFAPPPIGGIAAGTRYSSANVSFTPVHVRSGADNTLIWKYESFEAPSDIFAVYLSYQVNGLPDLNGDKVGDLLVDDPLYLPDLTKIHRYVYYSGADGDLLFKFVVAGTFSFPALAGDVTGDGLDDVLIINGDILDLWGTLYSGNGTAVWSRRVMTMRTASYTSAVPLIRTHFITSNQTETDDFFLNFQLRTVQVYRTLFGPTPQQLLNTKPQLVKYTGLNGTVNWALPSFWDQNMTIVVDGMSPASQMFGTAHLYDHKQDRVAPAPLATPGQLAAGIATFGAAFALSFALGIRRWKP